MRKMAKEKESPFIGLIFVLGGINTHTINKSGCIKPTESDRGILKVRKVIYKC